MSRTCTSRLRVGYSTTTPLHPQGVKGLFLLHVSVLTRDIDIAILSVRPCVRPSVRHVPVLYGNDLT